MSTVSLFVHTGKPEAVALGDEVAAWLAGRDHRVVEPDGGDRIDLALAIGGDGTMLRATRRAVEHDAAILGINLGQLGYLAEVEPNGWEDALEGFFAGRHAIAERLLVTSRILAGTDAAGHPVEGALLPPALNEVVIEKQSMGRTVILGVSIDGEFFHTYVADGVILATPTGSTAYSLSARGPIVAPTHRALLLTAVSPHSLFDRSLVLEPSSTVEVAVLGDRPAAVAVDGEHAGVLTVGTRVAITAADRPARFVTFGGRDFHRILKAKFGLSDR
jgi:NAD+ kinase